MGRLKIKQEDNSKEVVAYLSDVQPIATDLDSLIDEVENVAGIGRTNETVKGNAEDIKNLQNNKVEKSSGKSLISDTEIQRLANVGNYDDAPVKQDIQNLQSNKANKVDVYTKAEIDNKVSAVYKYKGSVATFSTLPTASRTIGDVYNVLDTGINYAWDGTSWDDLGGVEALATASNNGLISKEDFTKLQNITAGATKVEKSTANGNIKLNGTETKVYDDTGLAGVGRTSETVKDNADDILTLQEDKVDKVDGKGLSVNDYTTTEKDKLGLIEAEANKTTIANNLTETVVGKALDATQGKVLDNKIGVLTEKVKPETLLNTTSQNLTGAVNEVNGEVVSAKQSTVKNKTFSSLDARLEESEQDLVAHKLNYATQLDLQINNDIKNGNFIEVAGWHGSGTINVENNIATLTLSYLPDISMVAFRTTTLLTKTIIGNKYYVSIDVYPKYNSLVRIKYGGAIDYSQTAIANIWNNRSLILTPTLSNYEIAYYSNINTAGYVIGDTIKFKNFIGINLTTTFGAGNEPTKQEMDLLITLLGGWFNGTITLTQKQLANWYLKMIRQNRTAIVALGGTII